MSEARSAGGDGSEDRGHDTDSLLPPVSGSPNRAAANARLASPIPQPRSAPQSEDNGGGNEGTDQPYDLASSPTNRPVYPPAQSALAEALSTSRGTPPSVAPFLPPPSHSDAGQSGSNVGSFAPRSSQDISGRGSPRPYEDFEVVRRHLAGPTDNSETDGAAESSSQAQAADTPAEKQSLHPDAASQAPAIDEDEFSSLQLQGGDVTREIYRRTEAEAISRQKPQRSKSMIVPRTDPIEEVADYNEIHQPGGFRRHHLQRNAPSPGPSTRAISTAGQTNTPQAQPGFMTRNFYEFLSLYGHFAGESMDDEDETESVAGSQAGSVYDQQRPSRASREAGERAPLLKRQSTYRKRKDDNKPKSGTAGTILILLKSFVGTGVLFLPRAFLNGGILFSFIVMILVSSISYYCFLLLTTSRLQLKGSYAEMAEMMYGPYLRSLVNSSLVVSQVGFASAYIVFTSENLRAFVLAVTQCRTDIDIKVMILLQLVVFLPLSLYRNLNNISFVVYIADVFIILGIIYLYYYDISTLAISGLGPGIVLFNENTWSLFIGTAVFTFEGIGLIIPIQDGMKKPQQLPHILGLVMIIITFIFVSMGALAYAAYGSKTETVILLNMNQENRFVNGVQLIYSLAILLSTPMQIFPAITIMENAIFTRSGKHNKDVKWRKNLFRFAVVMSAALIAWIGANDLDKFVALTGSFACIPLVYIYPPLIHKRALSDSKWQGRIDHLLCFCGFVLMAYTSALTIQSWATGQKESNPGYCDRS